MKKINVGIIGLGVGLRHLYEYKKMKDVNLYGVCDFDNKKCMLLKKKFPKLVIFKNAKSLIKNKFINLVSIASYDSHHFKHAKACAINKKNFFVEKPICLKSSELEILKKITNKNKIKFSTNFNLRTSKIFLDLKKKLNSDKKNLPYFIEGDYNSGRLYKLLEGWRGKEKYHSVVLGCSIHLIDLICWILNEYPVEVSGFENKIVTKKTIFKFADFSYATLKFKSGVICKITGNSGCIHPHFHNLNLYSKKFTFINSIAGMYFLTPGKKVKIKKMNSNLYKKRNRGMIIKSFVNQLLGKSEAIVNKSEIFKVMSICFSIIESTKNSKKIKVKYI